MELFGNFINESGLIDVPCKGKKFTWYNSNGNSMSRIDRFLISNSTVNDWGVSGQLVGPRDISDHCPIWLAADKENWGPKPFKFNNEWFAKDDFLVFAEREWKDIHVEGRGDFVLKEKLKIFKDRLKWWNRVVFGKIDLEVEETVGDINAGDVLAETVAPGGLSLEDTNSRKEAVTKFWTNLRIKENMLVQKSRIKWLKEGDSNSGFFHRAIKERRRHNHIGPLNVAGSMIEKVEEVKFEVHRHFARKFKVMEGEESFLEGITFDGINEEDRIFLEGPFLEEEIKEAIWGCGISKSPGPDGYSFLFIKRCWSFLKDDIFRYCNYFHSGGRISKSVTSSFLSLIPKSTNPVTLDDYRPICLVGCLHKIVSKLLASRLKKVLDRIISPCQSAFVPGRLMLDGVLVANEVMDYARKERKGCVLFKVDFEKAYDNVSWNFLRSMLTKMGFGSLWRKWMDNLIFQSKMSVLVNGSPTKEFEVEKGLRQGDPLSPFLFVIVAEGLAGLVRKSQELGEFEGFVVNGKCMVDLLQFADDTLIVGEGTWKHVWAIKAVLRAFELVSGLGINYHKSKLIGVNISSNFLDAASFVLSCRKEDSSVNFLGIPIGSNPRKASTWNPLLLKIKKRLLGWKNRFLSLGGRITLLKSVLCSLYIFTLSFFKMPSAVSKEVNKILSDFLWGSVEERRKIHWVSWKKVCLPIDKGGLGMKYLPDFNVALLNKWRWRILKGGDEVWLRLLKARYGDISSVMLSKGTHSLISNSSPPHSTTSSPSSSYWWKDLISIGKFGHLDPMVRLCNFKIGRGFTTPFWEVNWTGNFCLTDEFLNLYKETRLRLVSVAGMGGWVDHVWRWGDLGLAPAEVSGGSGPNGQEVGSLRELIQPFEPESSGSDTVSWVGEPDSIFSVASCYKFYEFFRIPMGPPNIHDDAFRLIWKDEVPFKIKAFAWRLFNNRLPTKDLLAARGVVFSGENSLCVFCAIHPEDCVHSFFKCNVLKVVWRSIANWIGKSWIEEDDCFCSYKDWFIYCKDNNFKKGKLGVVWLALTWCIWLTRNGFCFRNEAWNVDSLIWNVKILVWKWRPIGEITYPNCCFYDFSKEPLFFLK
ncbi:unnamed protein product [Lathyrus sativus]|nr:unnamed protein product [Lathyrus sativus]